MEIRSIENTHLCSLTRLTRGRHRQHIAELPTACCLCWTLQPKHPLNRYQGPLSNIFRNFNLRFHLRHGPEDPVICEISGYDVLKVDGGIKVGCAFVSNETIEKIYRATVGREEK